MKLEYYQIETLRDLREMSERMRLMSDEDICELYRRWSQETYGTWVGHNEGSLKSFLRWLDMTPVDQMYESRITGLQYEVDSLKKREAHIFKVLYSRFNITEAAVEEQLKKTIDDGILWSITQQS